jgi:hypothetical protein
MQKLTGAQLDFHYVVAGLLIEGVMSANEMVDLLLNEALKILITHEADEEDIRILSKALYQTYFGLLENYKEFLKEENL